MLVKLPEHSLVLLPARPQSIANFGAGGRMPKRLNLNENSGTAFGDFPILAATGHGADSKVSSTSEGVI